MQRRILISLRGRRPFPKVHAVKSNSASWFSIHYLCYRQAVCLHHNGDFKNVHEPILYNYFNQHYDKQIENKTNVRIISG